MTHTSPPALYHYTDTARLPWILSSGVLKPDDNRIGGLPQDVLWATTSPVGDRTSSQDRGFGWRGGNVWHCRFVLDATGFEPWAEARDSVGFPPHLIDRLERAKGADPATWWVRRDTLPITASMIEVRSYMDNRWRQAEISAPFPVDAGDARGVFVGGRIFASAQEAGVAGGKTYTVLDFGIAA